MHRAVVIGSGPNGLAAAVVLAEAGLEVEVVEAHREIGGGTRTAELTLAGFRHDVCSAIHPLARASPVFRELEIDWPLATTPSHLMTMAFHEDLEDAGRLAMRAMIRILEEHYGLSFHDAYHLCSMAADMRVTQFVNGNRGIHVMPEHRLRSWGRNRLS